MQRGIVFMFLVAAIASRAAAQETPGFARLSADSIAAQMKTLTEAARKSPTGSATATLNKYAKHYSMLAVRVKTGEAEVHANYDDVFYLLDCEATVIIGGTVVDTKTPAEGETRGSRLEGGSSTALHAGDVVHIAAGTPHWMVLAPGMSCNYYVEKVAAK